jgi:uncharacterized metal-binding protein YceD (DUF177 family)
VNDLILNIDALEEANKPFEADLSREFLDSVLRADPPTEFHAGGASLTSPCKRCLKPVTLSEEMELVRTFVPAEQQKPAREHKSVEAEGSFEPALVDEETYQGKELDLTFAVREQILLSLPTAPLCAADCKGLCPKCGKDLNDGECGCDRAVLDPRWSALKGIQLDSKKEK